MYDPFETKWKLKQQDYKLVEVALIKSIKNGFKE